eukprot:4027325-Prymnesium_polylepis.1
MSRSSSRTCCARACGRRIARAPPADAGRRRPTPAEVEAGSGRLVEGTCACSPKTCACARQKVGCREAARSSAGLQERQPEARRGPPALPGWRGEETRVTPDRRNVNLSPTPYSRRSSALESGTVQAMEDQSDFMPSVLLSWHVGQRTYSGGGGHM